MPGERRLDGAAGGQETPRAQSVQEHQTNEYFVPAAHHHPWTDNSGALLSPTYPTPGMEPRPRPQVQLYPPAYPLGYYPAEIHPRFEHAAEEEEEDRRPYPEYPYRSPPDATVTGAGSSEQQHGPPGGPPLEELCARVWEAFQDWYQRGAPNPTDPRRRALDSPSLASPPQDFHGSARRGEEDWRSPPCVDAPQQELGGLPGSGRNVTSEAGSAALLEHYVVAEREKYDRRIDEWRTQEAMPESRPAVVAPRSLGGDEKADETTAIISWEGKLRRSVASAPAEGATLMLKKTPYKMTGDLLMLHFLPYLGDAINLLYLPMDLSKRPPINLGYSFLNFVDAGSALRVARSVNRGEITLQSDPPASPHPGLLRLPGSSSSSCHGEDSPPPEFAMAKLQGLTNCLRNFRRSITRVKCFRYRPMKFRIVDDSARREAEGSTVIIQRADGKKVEIRYLAPDDLLPEPPQAAA